MKFLNLLFVLAFVFSLASCGGAKKEEGGDKAADSTANKTETATTTEPSATTTTTEPSATTTTTEPSATTATEKGK